MFKFSPNGVSPENRAFALVIGLGVTTCVSRILLLFAVQDLEPTPRVHLPMFFRYDAALLFLIAWLTCSPLFPSFAFRRFRYAALWSISSVLIAVTSINLVVYRQLHVPATYRLFVVSDNLRGLHGALGETLGGVLGFTVLELILMITVAAFATRVPKLLSASRDTFFSRSMTVFLLVVLGVVELWARPQQYVGVAANPLWTFVASFPHLDLPYLPAGNADTADFLAPSKLAARSTGPLAVIGRNDKRARPTNVLMVVMESVGAKWLGVYGAPYRTGAVIEQLAERGALFSRVYASAPNSSSAMASLFSSVYPFHGLQTIPRVYPNLGIPGLPQLFSNRGYRTALIHGGTLDYDDNRLFLEHQGFAELFDDSAPASLYTSSDVGTLAQAQWWLDKSAAQPFFLVVWTNQTHFPYHNDQSGGSAPATSGSSDTSTVFLQLIG